MPWDHDHAAYGHCETCAQQVQDVRPPRYEDGQLVLLGDRITYPGWRVPEQSIIINIRWNGYQREIWIHVFGSESLVLRTHIEHLTLMERAEPVLPQELETAPPRRRRWIRRSNHAR